MVEFRGVTKLYPRAGGQRLEALVDLSFGIAPGELTHAERQRLLLARALASVPSLLLADEPTAMLDGPTTDEILSLLRAAQARGMTVFVATHAPEVAARLGGRRLRLDAGRLR